MDDERKYNHITPKFILDNFAFEMKSKKGKSVYLVYKHDKIIKKDIVESTKNICGEDYLYETLNENNEIDKGDRFNVNETSLGNCEGNLWAPLCRKIIDIPNTEFDENDVNNLYLLFVMQLLRTPVAIDSIKEFVKDFTKTNLHKELTGYELDQWAKAYIFPFHNLHKYCFPPILLLEAIKNNRIAIYRINENDTKAKFIINGEEPVIIYPLSSHEKMYYSWFIPISPTVCLGLIDDSLMRDYLKVMPPMYHLEATEDFIKLMNNFSVALPGRTLVSQIKINENRKILF